jgi:hypothetical protein
MATTTGHEHRECTRCLASRRTDLVEIADTGHRRTPTSGVSLCGAMFDRALWPVEQGWRLDWRGRTAWARKETR